jgi:hypothetical protein
MPTYRLVGGPCDGNTQFYYTRPPVGTVLPCGFHDYVFAADGSFHDGGLSGGGGGGTISFGTHGPRGWADLQKSVNRTLPTALRRAYAVRRATLHTIARRRRVR